MKKENKLWNFGGTHCATLDEMLNFPGLLRVAIVPCEEVTLSEHLGDYNIRLGVGSLGAAIDPPKDGRRPHPIMTTNSMEMTRLVRRRKGKGGGISQMDDKAIWDHVISQIDGDE